MQSKQRKSLLMSLLKELKAHIHCQEGQFAKLVIADFEDCLAQSTAPLKTTYHWLQTYQSLQ